MLGFVSRFLALAMALVVFRASGFVRTLLESRPELLDGPTSVVRPPVSAKLVLSTVAALLLFLSLETLLRRRLERPQESSWVGTIRRALDTSWPLYLLAAFGLTLVPGVALVPMIGWWLLLDARAWLVLVVALALAWEKLEPVSRLSLASVPRPGVGLFVTSFLLLLLLTPTRRFTQPYDERWGTGDEPRYVRIAASLLHDGDTDVANAGKTRLKTATPAGITSSALRLAASPVDAVLGLVDGASRGTARGLGGQVIRGEDGGLYYVYLPGFPLLLTPAMALDSILWADRLILTLATCIVIASLLTLAIGRLVERFAGSSGVATLLALGLALSLPLVLHSSQVYPELTATLAVAVMLHVVLLRKLTLRAVSGFALCGALLPWLHTKYYPLWGVLLAAFAWRSLRDKVPRSWIGIGIGLPVVFVGLQCLHVHEISGSFSPDALWVLNGKARADALLGPETLAGLEFILLDRADGFLAYSGFYVFAIPGLFALRRDSRFAFWVSLALLLPYLLVVASHDAGGRGGWSPPGRYMLPVIPVLALAMGAWIAKERSRGTILVLSMAGSFLIGLAMLEQFHFPYDRIAFLRSRIVDPSPFLGAGGGVARLALPSLLAVTLVLARLWSRRGWRARPVRLTVVFVALLLASGTVFTAGVAGDAWLHRKRLRAQLRPGIEVAIAIGPCAATSPKLVFEGAGGDHPVTIRGPDIERHLVPPGEGESELVVTTRPIRRYLEGRRELWYVLRVRLEPGGRPLTVRGSCRSGAGRSDG